ncbi:unnamed protein product [Brachionus calyciflorus]|uniref:Uncharacterized protein n=1 Tax=Brachionus calyciflorus TaxID=104777 RepID=A0A814I2N7_9BILA|nr:unnamed protein product [Brachionus calyciflorus]
MDNIQIILPCGYTTDYKNLQTQSKTIECPVCESHFIDVEQCLNVPKNRLCVKSKLMEIECKKLLELRERYDSNKQKIKVNLTQNLDKIKQEIDERRQKLNENIDSAIDDYYMDLIDRIEKEKSKAKDLVDIKSNEFESQFENLDIKILSQEISIANLKKVDEFLNNIESMKKTFDCLISNVERGKEYRFIKSNENFNFKEFLGQVLPKPNFNYSLYRTLDNHTGHVYDLALIGQHTLLSASRDMEIKSWNIDTGDLIETFIGHTNTIFCITVINEELFATGSADNTIKIWNLNFNECLKTLEGHSKWVFKLITFKSDKIISASYDMTIKIWDYENELCLNTLLGHVSIIRNIELLNDELLVSSSFDKDIKIWDINSGQKLKNIDCQTLIYSSIVLDKNIIATGSLETIRIWNIDSGECIQKFYGHNDIVFQLKKYGENHLISCSYDGSIRIWDLVSKCCVKTIDGELNPCLSLLITDDYEIFCGKESGLIKSWKLS